MKTFDQIFPRGLIVSCQAPKGEPLHGSHYMAAMAVAAKMGGAIGIRANGESDIQAIRAQVDLPIIGIHKVHYPDSPVYITPTYQDAVPVAKAGAHALAIDCTNRPRPGGEDLGNLIQRIHNELKVPVMADVASFEEGVHAVELGADAVASTLSGYIDEAGSLPKGPDLRLIRKLAKEVSVPVIAEGRYHTPQDTVEAISAGAYAVVVGTAITRPQVITQSFVEAIRSCANL